MSAKQPYDEIQNPSEVLDQNASEEREKIVQKRKRYLKFTVCSLFGGSVGLFARNFFCAIPLLLLFAAYILLSD